MDTATMLAYAKKYLSYGWPVIPCRLTADKDGKVQKKPCVSWREFQTRLPNEAMLESWWRAYPDAHLGVVTGGNAGIFAVDCDVGHTAADLASLGLPETMSSVTPSGGRHYFLKHPGGVKIKTIAGLLPKIDIRGDGGFIVLPPSSYPDGRKYAWATSGTPMAAAPEALIEKVKDRKAESGERTDFSSIIEGAGEGQRSQSAVQVAGLFLRFMPQEYWGREVWHMIKLWNQQNSPPLPEKELMANFYSIMGAERNRRQRYMDSLKKTI